MINKDSKEFSLAYDMLTIGMTINALYNVGEIDLEHNHFEDTSDEALTEFAIELSEGWEAYVEKMEEENEMYCWDWYIEEAIIKKYGRNKG